MGEFWAPIKGASYILEVNMNNLNIVSFQEEVIDLLGLEFDTEVEIAASDRAKNNGTFAHGVSIKKPGCALTPVVYLEGYFERYQNGLPMDDIICSIVKALNEAGTVQPDVSFFQDYEQVKSRLYLKPINTAMNVSSLEELVHEEFLDISLVPFVAVMIDGTRGSVLVRKEHLATWDKTAEEVIADASASLNEAPVIKGIGEFMKDSGSPLPMEEEPQMYVCTNTDKLFGAAYLCSDAIREFAQKVESDLYIIPSSIHELLLLPKKYVDPELVPMMARMVHNVNRSEVMPDEVLSDSVYYYDLEKGEVSFFFDARSDKYEE